MTKAAREWLTAFDGLPRADQVEVMIELLRRSAGSPDLGEATLHEIADDLFRSYDAEEAAGAAGHRRDLSLDSKVGRLAAR